MIKKWDEFKINEMKWYNYVLATSLSLAVTHLVLDPAFDRINTVRKLYSDINNHNTTNEEQKRIDSLRLNVINQIECSDLFDRLGKPFILDSLSQVGIIVTDDILSFANAEGMYINITPVKKQGLYKNILKEPLLDNVIIIKRDTFPIAEDLLVHELYHYFDALINDYSLSNIDIDIIDSTNYNTEIEPSDSYGYGLRKYYQLTGFNRYSRIRHRGEDIGYINYLYNNKEYFTSPSEIFARYNTLRWHMFKDGYLNNFNQAITKKNLLNFLSHDPDNNEEYISFLFFIDLDKLEKLEKL